MATLPTASSPLNWGTAYNNVISEEHNNDGTHSDITCDSITALGPIVDVKAYGATGDGQTNDHTAIQAAITAMTEYTTLYFPPGVYAIDNPLVFPDVFGWKVIGNRCAIIKATAAMTSIFEGGGGSWRNTASGDEELKFGEYPDTGTAGTFPGLYRWQGIQIDGMLFHCDSNANYGVHLNTSGHDIRITQCDIFHPVVSGILVDDFIFDVYIDSCRVTGGDGYTNTKLDESPSEYYVGGTDNNCIGIELACSDASITNCVIQACDIGIKLDRIDTGVNQIANIFIRGNHIYHISGTGILCESRGVSIIQNQFDLCEVYNIRISNETSGATPAMGMVDIIANNFLGTGTYYFDSGATPKYFYFESGTAGSLINDVAIIGNNFQGSLTQIDGNANATWGTNNHIHSNRGNWSDQTSVGNVVARHPLNDSNLYIDRPAGKFGTISLLTNWANRWTMGVDSGAESGSDAGSNFSINAWDDAGTGSTPAITINRATGSVTFPVGHNSTAVSRTATADGTGDAVIASGTSFVSIAGVTVGVNDWVTLPVPVGGNIIWVSNVSGSACEIRANDPATVSINTVSGAGKEVAIADGAMCRFIATTATTWIATMFAADGTESAPVPD